MWELMGLVLEQKKKLETKIEEEQNKTLYVHYIFSTRGYDFSLEQITLLIGKHKSTPRKLSQKNSTKIQKKY